MQFEKEIERVQREFDRKLAQKIKEYFHLRKGYYKRITSNIYFVRHGGYKLKEKVSQFKWNSVVAIIEIDNNYIPVRINYQIEEDGMTILVSNSDYAYSLHILYKYILRKYRH